MAEELSGQVTSAIDTLHRDVETSIIQASLGVALDVGTATATHSLLDFDLVHALD
jgi:hypothetical protein